MLKFIALSGTVGVTENLYVYEALGKMLIIDCGVGFPDLEMHGVDLVIPDFSYIVKNKEKLAGIVVSQGHEDHIGALPFLMREIKSEIWASPLVTEFLKDKFKDYGVKGVKINPFTPENINFDIGPFKLHPFRVTHSVPDTVGFAIDTPEGRIFHVPEHKMDQNPVGGMCFDIERAKELAQKGAVFLASDCLGANKPGFTAGETEIEGNMLRIVENANNAVFMTAISSNIGRFQQMINVAQRTKRKVLFVGRSIQKKAEIAHNLGYLRYPENLIISFKDARNYYDKGLMYIISGCFGQIGSSLYRLATGEHERVEAKEGDTMIFSADPAPPYTKESEDFIVDALIEKGVDVHYYDLKEGLYVSGHGSQNDIVELFNIVKPRNYIPIGGTIRFMHAYKKLAVKNGANPKSIFTLKPGENLIFENGQVRMGEKVSAKEILVHGLGVGDIGKVVLADRAILGKQGIAVVVIKIDKNRKVSGTPEITSRGFVFEKIEKEFLIRAGSKLKVQLERKGGKMDKTNVQRITVDYLEKFFFQKTGRNPLVLPIVVEL